jgi:hypothetical protein
MSLPIPTLADRRRALRLLSLTPLMSAVALAACGGGGSDAGGPAPVPPPPVPPAPGVAGPAWFGFGRDAQHAANALIATQALNVIRWSAPVDLAPQFTPNGSLLIHYGSPVVTSNNTVILPVKTTAAGAFRIEARSGVNGGLIWSAPIDYVLPPHSWVPSCNFALTSTSPNRLYAPGAGGKLLVRDNADAATGTIQTVVFYGATTYAAAPATFDATIFINTPITVDANGTVFFGFQVTGANPAGLVSGLARVGPDGGGIWVSAAAAAGDSSIAKVATNCAPALSNDLSTVYVAVNTAPVQGVVQAGYLLALNSNTLATTGKAALFDPGFDTLERARISDDSTASPTIGPDGDVFYGVLESTYPSHNARGWLLHFDATLTALRTPGGFGWDDTASIVPSAMVPAYSGTSAYLLGVKYNNYEGTGTGDGRNRIAVIDPNASQTDPISGVPIMKEVLTILGPTFETGSTTAVKEWCINTMAVDPASSSILANSEDGVLYRWHLPTNSFTQRIHLTAGLGEAYTPTAIGADGAVYAINDSTLFSVGA